MPTPTGADTKLIAMCNRLQMIDESCVWLDTKPEEALEDLREDQLAKWWSIVNQIPALPVHSLAGTLAKAQAARCVFRMLGAENNTKDQFALALIDAILGPLEEVVANEVS